jgi:hypothetical protein
MGQFVKRYAFATVILSEDFAPACRSKTAVERSLVDHRLQGLVREFLREAAS